MGGMCGTRPRHASMYGRRRCEPPNAVSRLNKGLAGSYEDEKTTALSAQVILYTTTSCGSIPVLL